MSWKCRIALLSNAKTCTAGNSGLHGPGHTLVDATKAAAADQSAPGQAGQARAVQTLTLGQALRCATDVCGQRWGPPAAPRPATALWLCSSAQANVLPNLWKYFILDAAC